MTSLRPTPRRDSGRPYPLAELRRSVLVLQVDAERVHVAGLPALALPPLCGSRILFNRDCPACGATRSFVHLAHGDWTAAFAANRAAWLLAIAVLVQLPYRWIALRRKVDYPLGRRIPLLFGWFVIIALIGNWLAKVLGY